VEGDLQRRLGQNLRDHRLALGLSQEVFADVLHVHRTYMGGLERGERNVTLRTVERLASRLGVDPGTLLVAGDGMAARRARRPVTRRGSSLPRR
jgi:transcriptional regulator with XRE-family HTH domain